MSTPAPDVPPIEGKPRRLTRAVVARSSRAALVVGTLLTLLNQGDDLLGGRYSPALWWKIPLTYVVPFLVATYGALGQRGARERADAPAACGARSRAGVELLGESARKFRYASNDR